MQKTKLGITVGLLGSAMYFTGLFAGFLPAIILAGYVLIYEQNEWLRRCAVKVVSLMILFSLLGTLLKLIPDACNIVNNLIFTVSGGLGMLSVTRIFTALANGIDVAEKVVFVGLGLKALSQGTIVIPVIDRLIKEHMV